MKLAEWNYLGPRSTPQEVRGLRKAVFESQRYLGQAVIHKHRWNERDVKNGLAKPCPFHDTVLGSDRQYDPYCFGTGFLGGWDDGVITYITLADTQEDRIRIGAQGVLLFETHPAFTAPWTPNMGDGDLLITAVFQHDTWDLIEEIDRYVLDDMTPRAMRGFSNRKQGAGGYKFQQEGNLDKLPLNHEWQAVPIVFDYTKVPPAPYPPIGGDPVDYPVLTGTPSSTEFNFKFIGIDGGPSTEIELGFVVVGGGTENAISLGFKLNNDEPGTSFTFS